MSAAAVVLAAGKGTRFVSARAKVLHPIAGRSMLEWVLDALGELSLDRIVVVVGHQADEVRAEAEAVGLEGLTVVEQSEQRGTGHAVRTALEADGVGTTDTVLVVPGDTPLLRPEPLAELLSVAADHAASMLTTHLDDPTGYGRVLRDEDGMVSRVVEHGDATEAERRVTEVATSVYAFDRESLAREVSRLAAGNAQGEEYLTDVIEPLAASAQGAEGGSGEGGSGEKRQGVAGVAAAPEVVAGVNDRVELAKAGKLLRRRILEDLMRAGVSVVDPDTTYVEPTVRVEADATLLPGTHLEGACVVERDASVGPDCRMRDSRVGEGASVSYSVVNGSVVGPGAHVGPYAYLRSGAQLERGAKAGTFVEIKQSLIGEGSKVPHLSYVGDATLGRGVNIGAATVTVNYDGREKHQTVIEDGAFIGSDTMLIAPVRVGAEGYTGAGSVITTDVPDGALAVERSEQRIVHGYAERKRRRK